jgi:hypothetical protein
MANRKQKKPNLSVLKHLLDYSKNLHEQENQRNDKLTSVTNIYLVVITFAFTLLLGVLSLISPSAVNMLLKLSGDFQIVLFGGLGISVFLLLMSLIFTVLVVKVRSFERLCNPKEFVIEASIIKSEEEVISAIISHYVVATERNFLVNNKKAKYLSYALQSYIAGFIFLVFAIIGIFFFGR